MFSEVNHKAHPAVVSDSPLLHNLNPEQRAAVVLPNEHALILAGAGSGKTRVLTTRIAWLLQNGLVSPGGIMAVTFTNKAAKEMMTRLSAMLPVNVRGMWIGTFHGLCNRFLRSHYKMANLPQAFQILDTQDQLSAIKRLYKQFGIDDERYPAKQTMWFIASCKEDGLRPNAVEVSGEDSRKKIEIYQLYEDQCQREGVVDFGELMLRSYELLRDNDPIREHYQRRFRHILIDEFQDTNPLQWQALLSWLGSYAGSGGGGSAPSVFLVGDPKQSIYRFRRAEPQVFRAAQTFVREGLEGDLLSCDHTRRNAREVINTVNTVMLAAQETGEFEGFRVHTTSATKTGWVSRLPTISRDAADAGGSQRPEGQWRDSFTEPQVLPEETLRTLEARQAARWIAGHIASGMRPQDIMALSRKRAGLAPLQDELRKLHIAAQIGENTELADCCEVQDIVALLDVLVSPQHDLSLARVLKSPLFALGDEVLVQLAVQQRQEGGTWYELLQKQELPSDDLKSIAASLARWKVWVDQLPPHDALQAIFDDGDVLARFSTRVPAVQRAAVLSNLHTLLSVSLQLGGGRFVTPYGFVRALKAGGVKAPAAVVETAVRLLTIHGAKGLEADVVLLLDTDTKERNPDTMGVLVDWPGESAAPRKFVFLVSENNPPACAVQTLELEVAQRQREEMNTLYVAMTRARLGLALSSIEPAQPNAQSWWTRLSDLEGVSENALEHGSLPSDASLITSEAPFMLPELPVLTISARAIESPTSTAAFDDADDNFDSASSRVGKAMHRLLEWGDASEGSREAAAREFELSPPQALDAQSMAQRILQGEGAWVWRSDLIAWQGDEVALMYQGALLRIDRLVQLKSNQEWWVLDYKSHAAPQNDRALVTQLARYREAVHVIYPGSVVKAAFLTAQGAIVAI